ncbi:MAG: chemotaxis protein CheA [Chloroflexi bacterium]|nr:chemotaxis protein CheA [Chloroflexota bacterium]
MDNFADTLSQLSDRIRHLRAGEREAIIAIGAELEQCFDRLPSDDLDANELFNLVLEGMRAIFEQAQTPAPALTNRVADAVKLIGAFVQANGSGDTRSLLEANAALRSTLAGDVLEEPSPDATLTEPTAAPESEAPAAPADPGSLDDVAAWMVQMSCDDPSDRRRARDMLNALSQRYEATLRPVADLLGKAAQQFADAESGPPTERLARAGQMVEAAAFHLEIHNAVAQSDAAPDPRPVTPGTENAREAIPLPADDQPAPPVAARPVASAVTAPSPAAPPAAPDGELVELPADADTTLFGDFIAESTDYIKNAEAALLALEVDPDDMDSVNTVFRAFHTIKGTSLFLGLQIIGDLAHRAESLLARMRDHEIRCTGGYANLALRSIDLLEAWMQSLHNALGGNAIRKPATHDQLMQVLSNPEAAGLSGENEPAGGGPMRVGDILVAQHMATRTNVDDVAAHQADKPIGQALVKAGVAQVTDVGKALRVQREMATSGGADNDSSVRIRTNRLDKLIDMVGELVIAHSLVSQDADVLHGRQYGLARKVAQEGKIVRELQDLSMSMRMVPMKATFQKMARLIRDLAQKSGKQVNFVGEGEDTEIDRNMVDVINDPLVHMIRNAVDHGIETPEGRAQAGKPPIGVVRLSAAHTSGSVVVQIQDDGRGLNREKIIAKAIARGMIESEKNMSDSDVFNLVFEPGFSTADQVTDISGRGVGMDVVRRAIEALRGRITIQSEPGRGSTFTLKMPLTLAITDGMLVKVGTERYILPTFSILMSFRPEQNVLSTVGGRGEMVMLRGEMLAIVRLHKLFNVCRAIEDPTRGLLVVVGDGDKRCALLVDELLGQQQVVAKSLGDGIGKIPGVSGGAILGDGRIGLILDPAGVLALARQNGHAESLVRMAA